MGGNPDRFAGKILTSYEAKEKSIGFSDTLTLNSRTTFPVRSVGISSRLNAPSALFFSEQRKKGIDSLSEVPGARQISFSSLSDRMSSRQSSANNPVARVCQV